MKKLKLTRKEAKKILIGAGLAAGGAGGAYLANALTAYDLMGFGPLIGMAISVGLNYLRKLKAKLTKKK